MRQTLALRAWGIQQMPGLDAPETANITQNIFKYRDYTYNHIRDMIQEILLNFPVKRECRRRSFK